MAIITLNNNSLSSVTSLPAAIATGKVLQVVTSENSYQESTASTSLSDIKSASSTTWETSITPSSTSSKILAHANISWYIEMSGTAQDARCFLRMHQKIGSGSYSGLINNPYTGMFFYSAQRFDLSNWQQIFTNLSSPNTTSAVTYKFDKKSLSSSGYDLVINYGSTSTITLMEVAG